MNEYQATTPDDPPALDVAEVKSHLRSALRTGGSVETDDRLRRSWDFEDVLEDVCEPGYLDECVRAYLADPGDEKAAKALLNRIDDALEITAKRAAFGATRIL